MKSCSVSDGLAIFKALGSPVRVQILRLIQEKEGLNIKQIAQSLKIPVTTLSPHLNLLAEAGLIEFRDESLTHGTQKRCYFIKDWDQLLVNMALSGPDLQIYSAEIGVGHFSDFSVTPTCGMATSTSFVGQLDQPRYFIHPGSRQARIVWFTTGYLEYILPNFIPDHSVIEELTVSFEISSKPPVLRCMAFGYYLFPERCDPRHLDQPWRLRGPQRKIQSFLVVFFSESVWFAEKTDDHP